MSSGPTPFQVSVPQQKLESIHSRVKSYPWHTVATFDSTWTHGPPPEELGSICEYWTTKYNWRNTEEAINSLPNFTAQVLGHTIHFVHECGSGRNPRPLMLLHGWPYSFHSYTHLVPRLAHPERYGGNADDAFTVVVPSLPGFGFSSKPAKPINPREVASIMNELMTSALGYDKYIAHGGDWGSYTSELLGFHYPENCIGIHITMSSVRHHGGAPRSGDYVPGASDSEIAFAKKEKEVWDREKAYNLLQSTKPLKLAYALLDSPVGAASWILEAFAAWADLRGKKLTEVFTMEQLLDEVMVYLVTDSMNSATWIYVGDHQMGSWTLPAGKKIEVPVGVLSSPDPVFPMPPREVLERSHSVVMWRESEKGAHFPFYEIGDTVVEELLKFGKLVETTD